MKLTKSLIFKILLLAAVIIAAAFLIRDSSHMYSGRTYDVEMSTIEKYSMLKKWLDNSADFTAVADINRLKTKPALLKFFEDNLLAAEGGDIAAINSLFRPGTPIGMLSINLNLEGAGSLPFFSIIVQGDFKKMDLLKSITDDMSGQGASLVSKKINGVKVYWQEKSDAPFAFALPDNNHLVAGTMSSLEHIFEKPGAQPDFPFQNKDSALFGMLRASPRIRRALPPHFASLEYAVFSADDQDVLHISIECQDPNQASDLELFLSGMKAIYMIQAEENSRPLSALESIAIGKDGGLVRVDIPIDQIPEILSK
jgi:hypothetical protein